MLTSARSPAGAERLGRKDWGMWVSIIGVLSPELSLCPSLPIRAQACIALVTPTCPLAQLPRGQWQKEGEETEMMMTLFFFFFLLLEPGEGGCFASWTSAENSLPDNHLGAFIAF